jgi:hypothetical protein
MGFQAKRWYDYQRWSLETRVAPERAADASPLKLDDGCFSREKSGRLTSFRAQRRASKTADGNGAFELPSTASLLYNSVIGW